MRATSLIGILSMNPTGYAAAVFYALAYLAMTFTCFLVVVKVASDGRDLAIVQLAGLHRRSPLLAMALMVGVFSLGGIPPTIGFTGKFLVFTAAMERGYFLLVLIAMINVVVSLYYYIQVVRAAFLLEPDEELPRHQPICPCNPPHCGDGCRYRRRRHLPALSVSVGPGRRANPSVKKSFRLPSRNLNLDKFIHLDYLFMKTTGRRKMANLQIKGIDDDIYAELKKLAAAENRSVSQQTLFLIKDYLAKKQPLRTLKTPVQTLLELAGSWEGKESAEEIIAKIKKARKSSTKLKEGF